MTTELIRKRLSEEINMCKHSKSELSRMVGIGRSMLSAYCSSKKFPALDTFARLCKALDVSADYILGLTDEL